MQTFNGFVTGRLSDIHMTQEELAKRTGYCRQTFKKKLGKPKNLTVQDIDTIGDALGIKSEYLFKLANSWDAQ